MKNLKINSLFMKGVSKIKVILTVFAFCYLIQVKAQSIEREQIPSCSISEEYTSIDSAIGWSVTDNGYWMNSLNRIPNPAKELDSIKLGYNSSYAIGLNNFITIQLRKITIKDKEYVLFIRKYIAGNYKYPTINKGWEGYNAYDFYVFDKSELHRIFDSSKPLNVAYEVKINSLYAKPAFGFGEKEINLELIKEWIGKFVSRPRIMIQALSFDVFPVQTTSAKFVRFNFKNILSNSSEEFDPKSFDKEYFEVPYLTFDKFINNGEAL